MSGATGTDLIRHAKKRAFLEAFATTGIIGAAAEAAGIHRSTHYDWLDTDPDYATEFHHAELAAAEALETEARRRAVDGVDEPVFYEGQVVGTKRRYSDTLLIFMMKGAMPHKYRERFEHSGPDGGPIEVSSPLERLLGALAQIESRHAAAVEVTAELGSGEG